ncbi:MAG TPA: TIGR03067 domain-containing protein [Pirellulales bacterium]|nr:TIGR03067 domain-containing protein [Pirellulales bacterium]
MRCGIAMGLAVGIFMGADAPRNDAAPSGDALHGVWQLSSGEADGKVLSETQLKGGKLVIDGARYAVTLAKIGTITGTQTLGAAQELKTIDITDESGSHAGKTCLGIYELNENEFRVVFASPGGARPSKFETAPDSGQWMHVWKRIKP